MIKTRTLAKGLIALLALVALVGVVPWALWHYIGWPLPHQLPSWSQFTGSLDQHGIADSTLLKALACVVWVAWAVFVASVAVELDAAVRGRAARRVAGIGRLQPVVGRLLAAIVVAGVTLAPRPAVPSRPLAAAVATGRRPEAVVAMALVADANPPAPESSSNPPTSNAGAEVLSTYVVQRNDTLWGIAERELGDPLRWTEIYALNQGRAEPGGATFDDPNWIYPGWTLALPVASTTVSPPLPDEPASSVPAQPPPPTTAPPAHEPAAATPTPHRSGHAAHSPTVGGHARPVELPSGSVIAASFAAGVLSAVAIGRLRRRHGYRPSPPEPGRALGAPPLGPTIRRLAAALVPPDDADTAQESPVLDDDAPALPEDPAEHRERPDLLEVGEHNDTTISVTLSELGGIALCGAGADGVARAWITAMLTRSGHLAAEIVSTTVTTTRLLRGLGEVPGIRVLDDIEHLVRALEAEVLGRERKLDGEGLDDVLTYRKQNPAEPLSGILAVLDSVPEEWVPRLRTITDTGRHLGIGAVLLGHSEAAAVDLDLEDHTVVDIEGDERADHLRGVSLFSLNPSEATDILTAFAASEFRPTSEENPEWTEVIERMEHPLPAAEPWPEIICCSTSPTPVRVMVLGPMSITVDGKTIGRGLRSVAKELLAFYLLRPEGASVDEAVETLWPDTDPKQVHRQFWTAASNLRTKLRDGADSEAKVIDQHGDVYRLDPDIVSSDLWDFQRALAEAAHAPDEPAAVVALRQAVETVGGDLVHGAGWLWVEPAREDLHRRAVDAHLRLAELEERQGHLPAAEAVLEQVVDLDRYAEEPYRRLMVVQAGQGRIEAVRATWRLLQRRLLELDLDPDPTSGQLYRALTEPSPPRPAGAPGRPPSQGNGPTSNDL